MDILDNPQVSLIQVNELFHFTRYIYYTYHIYILYTPNIPKYECSPPRRKAADMLPMKSATLPAATNLVPEGRYFETCTLEWVLICMFFFVLMQLKYDHPPRLTCCVHGYQKISRSTSNQRFVAIIKNVNQSQKHVVHTTGGATKEFCIHS